VKRHTLLVTWAGGGAAGGAGWVEVATIGLETPGELPPPMLPELIPHAQHHEFDPLARLLELPEHAPQAPARVSGERLERLTLRLPAQAQAALPRHRPGSRGWSRRVLA
jgi:hypothetical protein